MGQLGPRPRLVLDLALIRFIIRRISTVKYYFRLYSPKNWEFWTIRQLATYDDRRNFLAEIVEVEIGGVAIYRPFEDFRRAKSYCHQYGAQGQRQVYF
ncbi:hypothetical protein TNCV_1189141 [Trichonephila clavipes]|nr:hypothetical protein TNCV_1189141 [Trichonephila clavipes]